MSWRHSSAVLSCQKPGQGRRPEPIYSPKQRPTVHHKPVPVANHLSPLSDTLAEK